jgi:hypothetical protein
MQHFVFGVVVGVENIGVHEVIRINARGITNS